MAMKFPVDFPEEMVTEILVRLPVISLLRCKSVCKSLLSKISNPNFIKSHVHHAVIASYKNPTPLAIENPQRAMHSYSFSDHSPAAQLRKQRKRQLVNEALVHAKNYPVHYERVVMPRFFYSDFQLVNSINGIICLADLKGAVVYLWNPTIRWYRKLHAPPSLATTSIPVRMGFGYDSISDDYKIIRFSYEKMSDDVPLLQVYSTYSNCWTEFRPSILKTQWVHSNSNIVVDGVLYLDGGHVLISFDLHNEVFGLILIPDAVQRDSLYILDFKGSVAMVFRSGEERHLWTLDNVVSGSWTKKFSIKTDSKTEICLTSYLGAGQFNGRIFLKEGTLFLYRLLYDHEKKESKPYGVGEENSFTVLKYTQTLVTLDGFEQVTWQQRTFRSISV